MTRATAISSVGYTGPVSTETVTATSGLPVSLAAVCQRLRLPFSDEDADVEAMTWAAVESIEHLAGRKLAAQTVRYWYDGPPNGLTIYMPEPFRSIVSVKTYSEYDAEATLSSAQYRVDPRRARIVIRDTFPDWPPVRLRDVDAMAIEATVGYATPADIPRELVEAVYLQVMVSYLRDTVTSAERVGYQHAIAAKVAQHQWRMGVA